ncbi:hypothetical protein [Nocardioides sp. WS12]|uniref:hypothetical protein n=1 Tax=Nocardioides sp. WS12 TaxID=2486272 RepID=UPI0015FBF942|nr:hypothetical protein [Nocardioides sp. WS12]
MPRRPAVPKLIIGRDLIVALPDGPSRVIDFIRTDDMELRVLLRLPNGDEVTKTLDWLVHTLQLENSILDQPAPIPVDDHLWNSQTEEKKQQIDQRMQDLAMILTGDPFGHIVNGTARGERFVVPRFDPRDVTLEERYARMSHDIDQRKRDGIKVYGGSAPDTLRGQLRLVRRTGDKRLLIHGNQGTTKSQPVPDEVQKIVDDYVAKHVGGSKRSIKSHVSLLREAITGAGLSDETSVRRLEKTFKRSAQGRGFYQHSSTQQGKDGRPKRDRAGQWSEVVPFKWMEIDSTPVNAVVIDQYGKTVTVTHCLVAVCAVTRIVAGLRLVTSSNPYDSREVRGLLWDCIRGSIGPARSALRALDLPAWVDIDPTPTLPTRFGAANTDRGAQFNCFGTISALNNLGSHARLNDPATGYQKPHVEAVHRTFDAFFQTMPGYKGANTMDRGRHVERGPMLRVEDMLELVRWFIDQIYHRREHSQLYYPDFPGRRFSPFEYFDHLVKGPGGRLSMNQDLSVALGLLETKNFALQQKGLFIDHRWYNSQELDDLKDRNLGDKGRPGLRVQAWIDDRHPEFVYALPPNVTAPIAIRDIDSIAPAPPLADLLDRELRDAVGVEALFGSQRVETREQVDEAQQALIHVANTLAVTCVAPKAKSGRIKASTSDERSPLESADTALATQPAGRTGRSKRPAAAGADERITKSSQPDSPADDLAASFERILGERKQG